MRARAPALRSALLLAALLVGLFALYVVYELGRYDAGYDRQAVAQQRTELEVKIEHLQKENREMRTQLAELDTFRVGRTHEQAEVARAIGAAAGAGRAAVPGARLLPRHRRRRAPPASD